MVSYIKQPIEFVFRVKKETFIKVHRKSDYSYISFTDMKLDREPSSNLPFSLSNAEITLIIGEEIPQKKKKYKHKGTMGHWKDIGGEDENIDIRLAYNKEKLDHLITSIEANEKNLLNLNILISIDEKEINKKRDDYESYLIEEFYIINKIQN